MLLPSTTCPDCNKNLNANKQEKQSEETRSASDSDTMQTLELSDRELKVTRANMPRVLVEKADDLKE